MKLPINYKPEIKIKHVSDDSIIIATTGYSVCELYRQDDLVQTLKSDFNIQKLSPPIYWFSRLKSFEEGRGDGQLLLMTLSKLCDEKGITIVNLVNPYGTLSYKLLISLYERNGFINYNDGLMIRYPKKE